MASNVCVLTTAHGFLDVRAYFTQVRTLASGGYYVRYIAKDVSGDNDSTLVPNVERCPIKPYSSRLLRMFLGSIHAFILALQSKASIYHFHDPELIPVCIVLKLLNGKRVIYDVHELVESQILSKKWIPYLFLRRVIAAVYSIVEKIGMYFFDKVILAEDDYLNFYKKKYFDLRKFEIIHNYPIASLAAPVLSPKKENNPKVLIYAGALAEERGIADIVRAVELISEPIELWLVGTWADENFHKYCESLPGYSKVRYLGFLPLDEVYRLISRADIGLSMLHPIGNYLTSYPTKVFDYMLHSKPAVMSNFPLWKSVFNGAVLFAIPQNPEDIALKIQTLLNNAPLRSELGETGRNLIETKYSWEKEGLRLLQLYKSLET